MAYHSGVPSGFEQEDKFWELRAAASLARLRRDRSTEACDLFAPVYGWFTEGFDMPDLGRWSNASRPAPLFGDAAIRRPIRTVFLVRRPPHPAVNSRVSSSACSASGSGRYRVRPIWRRGVRRRVAGVPRRGSEPAGTRPAPLPLLRPERIELDRLIEAASDVACSVRVPSRASWGRDRRTAGWRRLRGWTGGQPVAAEVEWGTMSGTFSPGNSVSASTNTSRLIRSRIFSAMRHTTMPP